MDTESGHGLQPWPVSFTERGTVFVITGGFGHSTSSIQASSIQASSIRACRIIP